MFWDGERWVDDAAQGVRTPPQRRRPGHRPTAILVASLIPALLIPFLSVSAAAPTLAAGGSAFPGGSLAASGSGFGARDWIQLRWDGSAAGMPAVRTSSQGTLGVLITIPTTAIAGSHVLSAAVRSTSSGRNGRSAVSTAILASTTVTVLNAGTGATTTSTPISTTTATVTPSPTPTPDPAPASTPVATPIATPTAARGSGPYGPGIGADGLGNQQIGGTDSGAMNTEAAYRFRATESSALSSIRVYIMGANAPGYGAGTGGTLRITVQTDDGSAGHFPSGTVLASIDVVHPATGAGNVYRFSTPAQLTAGVLYHVVFTNVDSSPTLNFVSVDGLYQRVRTVPRQPTIPDREWGQSVRFGFGAWQAEGITPIMALTYANGHTAGIGYMEVWPSTYQNVTASDKAREHFTVSGGNRTIQSVSLRSMRISGTSPLALTLQTASGTVLGSADIRSSQVPIGVPGSSASVWASADFASPVTLVSGQSYDLVLSSPSGTVYSVFCIRHGVEYGYPANTYFASGVAQYEDGGGAWQYFGYGSTHLAEGDLQFFLS